MKKIARKFTKRFIRPLIRQCGMDIVKYKSDQPGVDAFCDMKRILAGINDLVIVDVGANVGQTAGQLRNDYPTSKIHSFEPSPDTFKALQANCAKYENVECWNMGVGSENKSLKFIINDDSTMSSFLPPSKDAWGEVIGEVQVPVVTLDSFASRHDIPQIHIMKLDTQGFDLEVLKGSQELMRQNRINLILLEFNFWELYEDLPSFSQVFDYLDQHGYSLVSFYDFHYKDGLAAWTNGLFINNHFNQSRDNASL